MDEVINMKKTLSQYNNQHSKFLKATHSEGMRQPIDFASVQRTNAEKNFVKSDNGVIPSLGQSEKTRGFFKK